MRSLRSRTSQHIAPALAASVISRTNAIRIATSPSGIFGLRFVSSDSSPGASVLEVETRGHVRVLRLNRPQRKNALSSELGWSIAEAVREALRQAAGRPGFSPGAVIGIGVDATGSTPLPVDAKGNPLALDPAFENDPAAMAWLWKDHTAHAEAARITERAAETRPRFLLKCGGSYSAEWFWSKVWRCLKVAPEVFEAAASWVELADYIPAVLTGAGTPAGVQRCVCAAGHKAMYSRAWGGLPSKEFLARLDPRLAALRDRLFKEAYPPDRPAGLLSAEWAENLGLQEAIPVAATIESASETDLGTGVSHTVGLARWNAPNADTSSRTRLPVKRSSTRAAWKSSWMVCGC